MAPYTYRDLTGEQLSEGLKAIGMSAKQFAIHAGYNYGRVRRTIEGKDTLPHHATVILGLLTLPGAVDVLYGISEHYVSSNIPKDDWAKTAKDRGVYGDKKKGA